MEHIVVGFDGTEASFVAVDWVAERAERGPCRVEILTVHRENLLDEPAIASRDAEGRIRDRAPNAEVITRTVAGRMPASLLGVTENADLLVIGAHRRPPARSALTRWMPLRVVARSPVPTVVVPDDWARGEGPVLVGLDDDDSSAAAVPMAASEAESTGVSLMLLHAWQVPVPTTEAKSALFASSAQVKSAHRALLDHARDQTTEVHPGLNIETVLMKDNPSSALLTRSGRASLVVLGTHHRGLLQGAVLGSVCQDVLWQSHTPVCVVPAATGR